MEPLLKLYWTAVFKDGSEITQIDSNGTEHLYKEVLERFDQLDKFYLIHIIKDFKALVDLTQGLIFINGQKMDISSELRKEKFNIRLIFFRRHTVTTINSVEKNHNIIYFLGYQYNDKDGNNHQSLIQIDQDANLIIGAK